MTPFQILLLIFAITSIAINIFILSYQEIHNFKWYFMVSTLLGIFFGFYRLYSIFRKH
jgi:hypothetical protein